MKSLPQAPPACDGTAVHHASSALERLYPCVAGAEGHAQPGANVQSGGCRLSLSKSALPEHQDTIQVAVLFMMIKIVTFLGTDALALKVAPSVLSGAVAITVALCAQVFGSFNNQVQGKREYTRSDALKCLAFAACLEKVESAPVL